MFYVAETRELIYMDLSYSSVDHSQDVALYEGEFDSPLIQIRSASDMPC